jgi:uncharacterized protein YggT (Ycf19 family)
MGGLDVSFIVVFLVIQLVANQALSSARYCSPF